MPVVTLAFLGADFRFFDLLLVVPPDPRRYWDNDRAKLAISRSLGPDL